MITENNKYYKTQKNFEFAKLSQKYSVSPLN